MTDDNKASSQQQGNVEVEKRGLGADALTALATALGTGGGTYLGNKLSGGNGPKHDAPPPPPKIELPPGVDRE